MRLDRDQLGLLLAHVWAQRGTCARRRVGCVLMDHDGYLLASGYNGPASGSAHCVDHPCPGAGMESGAGLELCEAIHAEANALMRCRDVREVHTAYCTISPCLHCVKLLMNSGCSRVVSASPYVHDQAAEALWLSSQVRAADCLRQGNLVSMTRTWITLRPSWRLEHEADVFKEAW